MKNKKLIISIITLFLITASVLISYSVIKNKDKDTNSEKETTTKKENKTTDTFSYTPPLYKICDTDSCIYLLGSMHLGDLKIQKLSNKVMDAYNEMDNLAVEIDIVENTIDQTEFLLDSGTIEDITDEEFYTKLKDFQKKHLLFVYDTFKYFKLGYIETYISTLAYQELGYTVDGVDSYLLKKAHNEKKNIIPLETIEQQLSLLIDFDNELYIKNINEIIDNYDEVKKMCKELYNAYIGEDYEKLKEFIDEDSDDSNDNLTEKEKEYINALYYDRNIGMTEKIKEFLKDNKKVFVTVGSAHVIGNNGIIDLLGNDYTIELIK